jgi:hypothetical protein
MENKMSVTIQSRVPLHNFPLEDNLGTNGNDTTAIQSLKCVQIVLLHSNYRILSSYETRIMNTTK